MFQQPELFLQYHSSLDSSYLLSLIFPFRSRRLQDKSAHYNPDLQNLMELSFEKYFTLPIDTPLF